MFGMQPPGPQGQQLPPPPSLSPSHQQQQQQQYPSSSVPSDLQQYQQQQIMSGTSSPTSSGSGTRPSTSAQRSHLLNTSFSSSVGSADVNGHASGQSTGPILEMSNGGVPDTTAIAVQSQSADLTPATPSAIAQGSSSSTSTPTRGHQTSESSSSATQKNVHHSSRSSGNDHSTGEPSTSKKHRTKALIPPPSNVPRPSATVPPAPTPAMHWSRAKVHGQIPPKELRAQTVNLVGESVYVFGGTDAKSCFNNLYIFDAGKSNKDPANPNQEGAEGQRLIFCLCAFFVL